MDIMELEDIQGYVLAFADFTTLVTALRVSKSMKNFAEVLITEILLEKVHRCDLFDKWKSPVLSESINTINKTIIILEITKEFNKLFESLPDISCYIEYASEITEGMENLMNLLEKNLA